MGRLLDYISFIFGHTPPATPATPIDFDPGRAFRENLQLEWQITYEDSAGELTRRTITVLSLHGTKYPRYAYAFCHLRQDHRHFNLYRIKEAFDAETGEEVPVTYKLLSWLDGGSKPERQSFTISPSQSVEITTYADKPFSELVGADINDIEFRPAYLFNVQVTEATTWPHTIAIRGRAKRTKTAETRAWTGQKTFHANICDRGVYTETGEEIEDFEAFFRFLIDEFGTKTD